MIVQVDLKVEELRRPVRWQGESIVGAIRGYVDAHPGCVIIA